MNLNKILIVLYLLVGAVFMYGTILGLEEMIFAGNLLLIPIMVFYYFRKAKKIRIPILIAFLFFYLRDFFIVYDYSRFVEPTFISFYVSLSILNIYAAKEFQKSKVHFAEYLSFLIIYGFSFFLFISLAEMVPKVLPSHEILAYIYLFYIMVFLSLGFTVYFLKSHKASLWIMLCASSIAFAESCHFLKVLIVEDISVAIFYPVFHILAYFSLAMYGVNRRSRNTQPVLD